MTMQYRINISPPPGYMDARVLVSREYYVNGIAGVDEITRSFRGSARIWRSRKRWSYVKKLRPWRVRVSATLEMILTLKVGPAYAKRFEKGGAAIVVMAVTVRSWVLSRIFLPKLCTTVFFFSLARISWILLRGKSFPRVYPVQAMPSFCEKYINCDDGIFERQSH